MLSNSEVILTQITMTQYRRCISITVSNQ